MFTSPKKYMNLLQALTFSEFKLRDQGTFLGFLWTLLYPLSMFVALYAIFSKWLGQHVTNFPSYLLVGIVFWNFFAVSTANTLNVITRKAMLVKNINFPKEVLVVSTMLSIFISFAIEIVILLVFLFMLGVSYSLNIFFLPIVIFIEIIFILGVSFLLAPLHVYYRDVERIWSILIMLGFFLTPIFYPLFIIAENKQRIMFLNPMLHILNAARDCFLYQKAPQLGNLFYPLLIGLILLAAGYGFFKKKESDFPELV